MESMRGKKEDKKQINKGETEIKEVVEGIEETVEEEEEKIVEITEEELKDLKDELESKKKEVASYEDRALRLAAEMENLRKRLAKEKEEYLKFANERLIEQLLPVVDNLERTIEHARQSQNNEGILEGVVMTLKEFLSVLEQFGCTSIEATGKPFDPCFHEAICKQESSEVPENQIISEFQKGFILKDRLLRPAKVIVSSGKKGGSEKREKSEKIE